MSGKQSKKNAIIQKALRKEQTNYGKLAMVVFSVVLFVGVIIGLFILLGTPAKNTSTDTATTNRIVSALTSVSNADLDKIGLGTAKNIIKKVSGDTLIGPNGKPEILYVGAEYCPYCAIQRWGMVIALSRFGTFSGLGLTTSSSTDVYPSTHTITFKDSKFSSDFIDFVAVEQFGNIQQAGGGYNRLQTLTTDQQAIVNKYDNGNGIPFVDFANQFVFSGAAVAPDIIADMTWDDVINKLKDSNSPQTKAIFGSANLLTATICKITKDQPASVCSSQAIQTIEKEIQ